MKKILFIAFAAIAFTTASQAQDSSALRNERIKKEHDANRMNRPEMMSELNLTPDQQDKMKKLREDNRVKMEAIKNNTSLSDEQKQEQMKTLHVEQRKSMEALLTDEQKKKMKDLRKDQMMQHRDMKGGNDSTMHR